MYCMNNETFRYIPVVSFCLLTNYLSTSMLYNFPRIYRTRMHKDMQKFQNYKGTISKVMHCMKRKGAF